MFNHDDLSPRVRGEQANPALSGSNLREMPDATGERRRTLLSGRPGDRAGLPMFRARPAKVRALRDYLDILPSTLTRTEAAQVVPGLITPAMLRNADARGRGPRQRQYGSRGVLYPTVFFLEWLESRFL
jgi:hypothetical protein